MINLLPPRQKKEFLEEENLKIVLILITVSAFFLTALFFVLLLLDIIIRSNLEIQKITLGQQTSAPDKLRLESLNRDLAAFNQTMSGVESFYQNQTDLTDVLGQISKLLIASDIYLTEFNIVTSPPINENHSGQISLFGFAKKRDDLLKLKKDLEAVENFQEINFPSSSWVKPDNINFNATFKIK